MYFGQRTHQTAADGERVGVEGYWWHTHRCHGTILSLVRVMSWEARRDLIKQTKQKKN